MQVRFPVLRMGFIVPLLAGMVTLLSAGLSCAPKNGGNPSDAPSLTAAQANDLIRSLAADMPATLTESQALLLGKRDPGADSCVRCIPVGTLTGNMPPPMSTDSSGGPGTRLASLYLGNSRGKGPKEDLAWHQGLFRLILEGMVADTRKSAAGVSAMWLKVKQLSAGIQQWTAMPEGLEAPQVTNPQNWPSYCLQSMSAAIKTKNLVELKRWAGELASASFAINDLHLWLEFLLRNHLYALDFQAKCETLFDACDKPFAGKYVAIMDISGFPAGVLGLRGLENYLEVERQSERLFRVSGEFQAAVANGNATTPASRWMPPDLRGPFLQLREKLSPANQKTWDEAAHTPYERSYLANMLYRSSRALVLDRLGTVLGRFSAANPSATVPELMDVIFYRGGEAFSALEWGDRFDPRLMDIAGKLSGDKKQVAIGAKKAASSAFGGYSHYGVILTLREALDQKRFDCIRATDMIGALYRNAGRSGYYSARWCGGLEGHTVGAIETGEYGKREISMVDALAADALEPEPWPQALFRGHEWPNEFFRGFPDIYAVELSARGLDSHVWMEGYIIRGPTAGFLMRAAIPFRPGYAKPNAEKVFSGPYPETSAMKSLLSIRTRFPGNTMPADY